ncbi:hypothetical protein OIU78_010133 [Salix suchowensis]|nr:hypothetical protein OIU78_010133 [Salix suchowensis]
MVVLMLKLSMVVCIHMVPVVIGEPVLLLKIMAPCSSFSSCTLGGTSLGKACADSSPMMNPGKSFPPIDDNIVKTAMDAAERAMSSMTMNAPAVKSDIEANKAEKSEDNGGEITQNTSSETDLTVVLNAWYSAGFYTGKYLTERSIAKK